MGGSSGEERKDCGKGPNWRQRDLSIFQKKKSFRHPPHQAKGEGEETSKVGVKPRGERGNKLHSLVGGKGF